MKIKDLNGIWREDFDDRGRSDFRPLRPSMVTSVGTEVTPDEEERRFVPKRNLPCHGEPLMRLGFVRKSDGVEVAFELLCPRCRKEESERALRAGFDAMNNHESRVRAFLKAKRVRTDRRGNVVVRNQREEWER